MKQINMSHAILASNTSKTAHRSRWNAGVVFSMLGATLVLTGCGGNFGVAANPFTVAGPHLTGSMHGGQQPIAGATIQLYSANTAAYAGPSTALLTTPVTTDNGGNFAITGSYTCPSASTLVYLTAIGGGNPGSPVNPNSAILVPLGACGNLTPTTFISGNELTTVAGAFALSGFMTSPYALGTSAGNLTGLTNAFSTVNKLVNINAGILPGKTLPTGATEPTAAINTIANVLAACINSTGGASGDGSNCGILFANTTPAGGAAPTDTITAAINLAKNPGSNVANLIGIAGGVGAPFQPTSTTLTDFTLSLKYSGLNAPSAAAVDASGNLWVANKGNNSITVLAPAAVAPTVFTGGGLSSPSGIAFDQNGNAWLPDLGTSKLSVFTPGGTGTLTSLSGLSAPTAIAIDALNTLWITNSGNSSVTNVVVSGTSLTSSSSFTATGGVNTPVGVAINVH